MNGQNEADTDNNAVKIGLHFNNSMEVVLVSTSVSSNSKHVVEKSQLYIDGIRELLSRSSDITEMAKESAAAVEKQRNNVFAAKQLLSGLTEGRSPERKRIELSISKFKQEYEKKREELAKSLEQEEKIQKQIDEIIKPLPIAS